MHKKTFLGAVLAMVVVLLTVQPAEAGWRDWWRGLLASPPRPPVTVGAEEAPPAAPTPTADTSTTSTTTVTSPTPTDATTAPVNPTPNPTEVRDVPREVLRNDQPTMTDEQRRRDEEMRRNGESRDQNRAMTPEEQKRREMEMEEAKKRMLQDNDRREQPDRREQDTRRENTNTTSPTSTVTQGTGEDNRESDQPRFVDPRWVNDTMRQIRDQQRDLKRLLTQAKRLKDGGALAGKVQALTETLNTWQQKIKAAQGDDQQDALQEFHESQLWEEINVLRAQIEIPKRLAELEKSLTRAERVSKQKVFTKLSEIGLDLTKVKTDLAAMRTTLVDVKAKVAAGEFEEAQEAMQEVFEGGHPGEIEGVLQQMRGLTDSLRRIRNQEIRASVKEIFQPVIDAVNDGDYREANELLREMQGEMQRIFAQLYKVNRTVDANLRKKLDALEAKIEGKFHADEPLEQLEAFPPPAQ